MAGDTDTDEFNPLPDADPEDLELLPAGLTETSKDAEEPKIKWIPSRSPITSDIHLHLLIRADRDVSEEEILAEDEDCEADPPLAAAAFSWAAMWASSSCSC